MRKIKWFNEWLAIRGKVAFGTMWTCYIFFLYGFLPLIIPSWMNPLLYWSNTIQLWALPLLMVGQNVESRAAELRAQQDHEKIAAMFEVQFQELKELKDMHQELHFYLQRLNGSGSD